MATNNTSTDTTVSTTSTQAPSSPSSTPAPRSSSSSIANSSPSPVSSTTPLTSSATSSLILSTSSTPLTSSSTPSTSSTPPPSTTTPPSSSTFITSSPVQTTVNGQSTVTIFSTSTEIGQIPTNTGTSTSSSTSGASTASRQTHAATKGLSTGGTVAVAVVVPIVVVALLILGGIFFWRKRKQRKDAEELRRKEVEEYGYNPNNDPTLPAVGVVGSSGHDGQGYEMREDGSSGYRGWGTTAVPSSGRKASTTVSGGQSAGGIGMAYSEGTSPTHGPISDTNSGNPLVDGRPLSPEEEALGAMGPAASGNRSGDINRGPSNASSSYSAANRSDGSGENVISPVGGNYQYNQYDTGNPYGPETAYGSPPGRAEMSGAPVIRDVQARRNTRIENPSHFPQQSAGISQNF